MGWCEEEFDLMGQPFERRGARADEMLEVLRALWSGDWVEHHGEFYDLPRLEMNPPVAAPVPVYIGGLSPVALRRAARNDGWISDLISTDQAAEFRVRIDEEREKIGRADTDFSMFVSLNDAMTAEQFARAEDVGVTDILTMPWSYYGGFKLSLDAKIEGLHRFREEIMDPLDARP
jgi:alkanesulfonate monooxygenase SsuD/methylene tetrahydromethanopterin reductase-like flavin-dependent oxidoreductase (luciferase family)